MCINNAGPCICPKINNNLTYTIKMGDETHCLTQLYRPLNRCQLQEACWVAYLMLRYQQDKLLAVSLCS